MNVSEKGPQGRKSLIYGFRSHILEASLPSRRRLWSRRRGLPTAEQHSSPDPVSIKVLLAKAYVFRRILSSSLHPFFPWRLLSSLYLPFPLVQLSRSWSSSPVTSNRFTYHQSTQSPSSEPVISKESVLWKQFSLLLGTGSPVPVDVKHGPAMVFVFSKERSP